MESWTWQGPKWRVELSRESLTIVTQSETHHFDVSQASQIQIVRKWLRFRLLQNDAIVVTLRGLSSSDAAQLSARLCYLSLLPSLNDAVRRRSTAETFLIEHQRSAGWITTEEVESTLSHLTSTFSIETFRNGGCEPLLTDEELESIRYSPATFLHRVQILNDEFMAKELEERRDFFNKIERTPLSEEQSRAVISFDNRVQLLAAAGSGKTSVMVARAAYAVATGLVEPDRILLLAFNRAAAEELHHRITSRFEAAGISSEGVKATTFHSFGLEVIGRASGKKPRISEWLELGKELNLILAIVDQLRDESSQFRYSWDLYRLLFANAATKIVSDEPDGYNSKTGISGYRTCSGNLVRSEGERMIADFLFFNGVKFEYERSFEADVADSTHSQYHPDFYYPDADVWHEHWALNRDGHAPAEFKGYERDMEWKRSLHKLSGTKFVESTFGEVMFGDGLQNLQSELEGYGIEFDWNPDRPTTDPWVRPTKHTDLARLVRTFMSHVKSNSFDAEIIDARLQDELSESEGFRTRLFLSLYWPIHDEWQRRMTQDGVVDFEDMLINAAEILEEDPAQSSYQLVLVDEFQDSSQARARFVRSLLQKPGRYLLAVGDDWQSINRFAGADVSVMKEFDKWFGTGPSLALTTTFRCSQEICDVARTFVSKNPAQLEKSMQSSHGVIGRPVTVILTDDETKTIEDILRRLKSELHVGSDSSGMNVDVSVDILGRYHLQREVVPMNVPKGLTVAFRTIHGSKGLEADFVIVVGLATGTYGFPTNITDDPVMDLAMPAPESFPHAEERRLLYVALTRARSGVFLVAPLLQLSPFVIELMNQSNVAFETANGRVVTICPACRRGTLRELHGPYDPFLGCTRFPACRYKGRVSCPDCGTGILVRRSGKYGEFIGCSSYPGCRHTSKFRMQ